MAAESIANLVFTGPLQWAEQAACRGESRLFFAPAGERPEARAAREAQARNVCRACPALIEPADTAEIAGGERARGQAGGPHPLL